MTTHVSWPASAWLRDIAFQVIYPGQVIQAHGQVVTPMDPRWEIRTTIYGWTTAEMRTFLNSLGGAIASTQVPIVQPTRVGTVTLGARPVTGSSLLDDGSQLQLSTATPATFGMRAGQFWLVGTAGVKRLYEIVSVSGTGVNVVPGRLPPTGTNTMSPAAGVRVRLADPQQAAWGDYDALTGIHLGTTLRWFEV